MLIQATEGHFECQVFCAKTIVIVKDCCLVAGGLCRSMAGRGLVSGSRRTKFRRWMERSGTPAEPPATIASLDNSPQRTKNANQPGFYVEPEIEINQASSDAARRTTKRRPCADGVHVAPIAPLKRGSGGLRSPEAKHKKTAGFSPRRFICASEGTRTHTHKGTRS